MISQALQSSSESVDGVRFRRLCSLPLDYRLAKAQYNDFSVRRSRGVSLELEPDWLDAAIVKMLHTF